MQEKLFDQDILSAEHIDWNGKFLVWAQSHMNLCDGYTDEKDEKMRNHLRKRIEFSMNYGRQLLNSIAQSSQRPGSKPLIPLSGMNRFSNDPYATHDGSVKNRKVTKFDSKDSSEPRKPCLPSKTYLTKKKEN